MDTITNVSKMILECAGGYESSYLNGVYSARSWLVNDTDSTSVPLEVFADSNKLEIEFYVVLPTIPYASDNTILSTDDGSFVIKTNSSGNLEVNLGNVTLVSATVVDGYFVQDLYSRVTIENNVLSMYNVYLKRSNTGSSMAYNYNQVNYTTLPFTSQRFCLYGISGSYSQANCQISYVRIKKDNVLVFNGLPAVKVDQSSITGIYDKINGTFSVPSTGSTSVSNYVKQKYGVFYLSLATSVNCNECPWVNNSAESAFIQSRSLTNVTLPSTVRSIYSAFTNCPNLRDVYILSPNVTNIQSAFYYANTYSNINVHVPANSQTYNTFIYAGYDDQGTKEKVVLLGDL